MQMKSENVKNVRISTRFDRVELFEREAGVSKTSCSYGDYEKKVIYDEKVARTLRYVVLS
jgi:hypothetical protein